MSAPGSPSTGDDDFARLSFDSDSEKEVAKAPEQVAQDFAVSTASEDPPVPSTFDTPRHGRTPNLLSAWFGKKKGADGRPVDLDDIATQPSVFDDPVTAKAYQPNAKWENIKAFDPNFRWTWREEKKLVRHLDWRITAWGCIMFVALNIDRSNIIQAVSDNMLNDLHLTTDDYNMGNTLAKLSFLLAELPSQLISKRIGPDVWIPMQMCVWSIISASQFWLKGRAGFLATRFLIGLAQGGFIPDLVLYFSYFFTKDELSLRLAGFWMALDMTSILQSFMAFGVLHMRGVGGAAGWRWLFLLEAILTLLLGVASFFLMVPGPLQTKTYFRPGGWFTEREEKIIVNRVLRDDPTKSDMHNRQGLTWKMLWQSLTDFDLWPLYLIGLTFEIPTTPVTTYITLSLRQLGFSTFKTNLLCIPYEFAQVLTLFAITWLSEKFDSRSWLGMAENLWALPCLIALYSLRDPGPWQYFVLTTVLLAYPYVHAIQVSWCSRNSGSVRTRTVSASLYNMMVQVSAIISSNIYRQDDAPEYRRGNRQLIAIACTNLALYPLSRAYYKFRNREKERKWSSMTREEQAEYLKTTTDQGNRRLDFRFAY